MFSWVEICVCEGQLRVSHPMNLKKKRETRPQPERLGVFIDFSVFQPLKGISEIQKCTYDKQRSSNKGGGGVKTQ